MLAASKTPGISFEEMETAFYGRDDSYDGIFFTGVKTTGIFCKPSCTARKPLKENIVYYSSAAEAMFAGFRACKRCRPLDMGSDVPPWVPALIAQIDADPESPVRARDLLDQDLNPATVRRTFQKHFGMSFAAYCRARRLGQAFSHLRRGMKIDDAVFAHGYESHSGMRTAFFKTFGIPPGRADQHDVIRLAWMETVLGPMIAGAVDAGICLLEFTDRRMLETQFKVLRHRLGLPLVPGHHPHLELLQTELEEYFAGDRQAFEVPVVQPGTAFQQAVWHELRNIPYGECRTYTDLAKAVGSPKAVRAVGTANGCNRIAIIYPCHRVINADGRLGGYGGGVHRKQRLLDLERKFAPATS